MSGLFNWLLEHEPEFNDKRLPSLYSDLGQQKSSNPDGFLANAIAWEHALTGAALAGQLPTEQKILLQSSNDLLDVLRSPRYGLPTGLGSVLDLAIRNGKMMDLKDFTNAENSIYMKSWIPSIGMIVRWTLNQAGLSNNASYDLSGRLKHGQLVLIDNLERISSQIVSRQAANGQALTDRVMSRETFAQLLSKTETGHLSTRETECLLLYLSRDKHLLAYNSHTIKFKDPASDHPEPISQEDDTIASLKALITSLEARIVSLNARSTGYQDSAHAAVRSKNKNAALTALRSKKLAELNIQKTTDALHQLEEVYAKIAQAVDQVQIVQAMQSSAETLKSLNQRVGGVDKVDMIMDDLREQMSQTNEVSHALQEPLSATSALDEVEVDDELEALEKEERAREEQLHETATQAKLAELADVQERAEAKAAADARKEATNTALDAELENSTQRLTRMQLEDDDKQITETRQPIRNAELST